MVTRQQRNNVVCALFIHPGAFAVSVDIDAVRNTEALTFGYVAHKTAVGIPSVRLALIEIANLDNGKIYTGVLDGLPVNVLLIAAYIDALRNSTARHHMHRLRFDTVIFFRCNNTRIN